MEDVDTLFGNRKVRTEQLVLFGFVASRDRHTYSTTLLDGQFEMRVEVANDGAVSAEVIDSASGEGYILHRIADASGPFVGRVREEYAEVLLAIAASCFDSGVFSGEIAQHVIRYVREKYRGELEFLWERSPRNAVFRRRDNAKWFAALLSVQKQKLGLHGDGIIEIIDLRMRPEDIVELTDGKRYFPGYHMNKKHWITICLDDSVSREEICSRIDDSYLLAVK